MFANKLITILRNLSSRPERKDLDATSTMTVLCMSLLCGMAMVARHLLRRPTEVFWNITRAHPELSLHSWLWWDCLLTLAVYGLGLFLILRIGGGFPVEAWRRFRAKWQPEG